MPSVAPAVGACRVDAADHMFYTALHRFTWFTFLTDLLSYGCN